MNILFVVPTLQVTGGNLIIVNFINSLSIKFNVKILCFFKVADELNFQREVEIIYATNLTKSKVNMFIAVINSLILLGFTNFDRIVTTHYTTLLHGMFCRSGRFVLLQGLEWNFINNKIFKFLILRALHLYKVIVTNDYLESEAKAQNFNIVKNMKIWPLNIPYIEYSPNRKYDFLMIVRNGYVKAPDRYEKLIKLLSSDGFRILIITDSSEIYERFKFFGCDIKFNVQNDIMYKFYSECKFYLLLSRSEGFSLTTAESLGCNMIAIATKCGGPEYLVTAKDTLLPNVDNELILYKGIKDILVLYDNDGYYRYNIEQNKINFNAMAGIYMNELATIGEVFEL